MNKHTKILRVIFRNDSPLLFSGDCPSYRSVAIELTPEQIKKIEPKFAYNTNGEDFYEDISKCFIEPEVNDEIITENDYNENEEYKKIKSERDRYRKALENIVRIPRYSIAYDPEGEARDALKPMWLLEEIEQTAKYYKNKEE